MLMSTLSLIARKKSLHIGSASIILLAAATGVLAQTAWIQTSAPNLYWSDVASSADGTKLFAIVGDTTGLHPGQIYVSTNSGYTWNATAAPTTNWLSIACSADGTKLVATVNSPGTMYRSTNSGATWTAATNAPDGCGSVAGSADGTRWLSGTANDYLYRSTNSGGSWNATTGTFGEYRAFASSANGSNLFATTFGVIVSTDAGNTWSGTSIPTSANGYLSVACSSDGTKVVAVTGATNTGFIYTSTNRGGNWTQSTVPKAFWLAAAASTDGKRLIAAAAGPGPLYTSTNSGVAWTSNSIAPKVWSSVASSADGTKLVASVKNGGIYTWQIVPSLSISTLTTNVILTWPSNNASSTFVLEQNPTLATNNWALTGITPSVVNQQYQVTVPAVSNMSYRLVYFR
jgi:hypothetical protein